jgi:hypothetical protein
MNVANTFLLLNTTNNGGESPPIPPVYENLFDGVTLDIFNAYIDVAFLFGVYNSDGGAVQATDLNLIFAANSGTATDCDISTITKPDGGPLVGGESIIRVNLTIEGSCSGVETIEIKPSAQGSIKDVRNIYILGTDTTGEELLKYTYNSAWREVVEYAIDDARPLPSVEELIIGSEKFDELETENALVEFDCMLLYFSTKKLFGLINVVSPGNDDAEEIGSPTWTSHSGFRSGGGGYVNNHFIPNDGVKFLQNDAASWIGIDNDANANALIASGVIGDGGADTTRGNIHFYPEVNAGTASYTLNRPSASNSTVANTVSTGLYVKSRETSTTNRLYKDGSEIANNAGVSGPRSTLPVYDTCKNVNGVASNFDTIHDINFRAFSSGMQDKIATVSAIFADWITQVKALPPDTTPPAPGPGGVNRLYMIAGQSNADGRGLVSALPGYLNGALSDCYIWIDGAWEVLEAGVNACNAYPSIRHGFIVSLAYEQRILYPNDILYFINAGFGGTTLHTHWVPVTGPTYIQCKSLFDAVIATGTTFTKHALNWYQGEGDTDTEEHATAYESEEQTLMDQFDTDFGFANKIAMSIPANTTDCPFVATVNAGKTNNAAAMYYTLINPVNPDLTVHLSSPELVDLGEQISAVL